VFATCLTDQVRASTLVIGVSVRPYANDKHSRTVRNARLYLEAQKRGKRKTKIMKEQINRHQVRNRKT